jgi:predicted Rossmann fold nucleotide-binding protein DprA/Smf involved in DNA uptake
MKNDSMAIVILCSYLGTKNGCIPSGAGPFTTREWSAIADTLLNHDLHPAALFDMGHAALVELFEGDTDVVARIEALSARSGSLAFEIENLSGKGIRIATRADKEYPVTIKKILKEKAPPLYYYAGLPNLSGFNCIGFVGSRDVSDGDRKFTEKIVRRVLEKNFGILSGGARGVDSIAAQVAIESNNAFAIEFVADSLTKKLKDSDTIKRVADEKLLLLSEAVPNAGFVVGMAMSRNKYIYAASQGTIVVKSDLKKGGTWNGATENLRNGWCSAYCWDNKEYPGNQALIEKGANAIDDEWDVDLSAPPEFPKKVNTLAQKAVQISFL